MALKALMLGQSIAMKEADKDWAVSFACPSDAEGMYMIYGRQSCDTRKLEEGWDFLEAGEDYLSPGFIDIHVHGGGGHDFMDASEEAVIGACMTHMRHGTTTIVRM